MFQADSSANALGRKHTGRFLRKQQVFLYLDSRTSRAERWDIRGEKEQAANQDLIPHMMGATGGFEAESDMI